MRVRNSNFVDYVKIFCRSGKGGSGSAHFLRDRNTAKGGPDGGDGVDDITTATSIPEFSSLLMPIASVMLIVGNRIKNKKK